MKRYLIYSNHFKGHAEVWYSEHGILLRIDLIKATFDLHEAIETFQRSVPVYVQYLEEAMQGFATTITEGQFKSI